MKKVLAILMALAFAFTAAPLAFAADQAAGDQTQMTTKKKKKVSKKKAAKPKKSKKATGDAGMTKQQ